MSKALPKTLFVKVEKNSGSEYFVADTTAHVLVEMGQRVKIATYRLVEINNYEGVATKLKG